MGTWFDGLGSEETVIIDDCYSTIPFSMYLGLMDARPYRVPIKGGVKEFVAKNVVVIANTLPETWYKNERGHMDFKALYRRFEEILYMDEDHEIQSFSSWEEFEEFLTTLTGAFTELPASPVV